MAENFLPDSSPSPPPSHFSRPLLAGLLCLWLCLLSQDVCFVSVSLYFFSHGRVMFTFYMKLALVLFNIILCPSINDCSFFKLNLLQFERHPYFLLPSLPPQIQQHQLHQLQFRHLHPQYQRWKPTAAWAPRPLLFSCPQTSSITTGGDENCTSWCRCCTLQDPKDGFREPCLPDQEPGEQEQLLAQQVSSTWPKAPYQGGLFTTRSEIEVHILK